MMLFMVLSVIFHTSKGYGNILQNDNSDFMNIVDEFSKQMKVTSIVFHCKEKLSVIAIINGMKREQLNLYVGFDTNAKQEGKAKKLTSSQKELHFYCDGNLDRLSQFVGSEKSCDNAVSLVRVPDWDRSKLKDIFKRTPLQLDSEVYAIMKEDTEINTYSIYDVYKIDKNSDEVEIAEFGDWNSATGLTVAEENIWKRRSNLKGHHLNVIAAVSPPFTTHLEDGCKISNCFKGIFADTFHKLQDAMNFTFTIEMVKTFGGIKNGSWTGMIGLLKDGKKDMSASGFFMKNSRASVVDYLPSIMSSNQQMYIRNPAEQYDWAAYILPLTKTSWIALIVFCISIPFIMALTMCELKDGNKPRKLKNYPLTSCFCLLYKSLLKMDLGNMPQNMRNRITFLSVAICGMFFFFLWEAMLISYVATPKVFRPFDSLDEFLQHSDKKLYVVKGTAYEYIFRNADDPTKKRIWHERMKQYIDDVDYPASKEELLPALMKDSKIVAYGNSLSQKSYELYKQCAVIALPKKYGMYQMGFVIPKNSSLTSAFSYFINRFIESGSIDRIKRKYELDEQVCPSYIGKPLGMESVFSMFGTFVIGLTLSSVCFSIELIFPKSWLQIIFSKGNDEVTRKSQNATKIGYRGREAHSMGTK